MAKRREGFTLLEIMIVVFLVGVLAVLATPYFVRSRLTTVASICAGNLRLIEAAKERYAFDYNMPGDTEPSEGDLASYFRSSKFPVCPAAGTPYTIGAINDTARCQNPDHRFVGEQPAP